MAASEVTKGHMHKDFGKMSIMMALILMELVKRSKSECPNDDFSKFRVYGILVAGRMFEFCIVSVVKSSEGKINFIFNTDNQSWKVELFRENLASYTNYDEEIVFCLDQRGRSKVLLPSDSNQS